MVKLPDDGGCMIKKLAHMALYLCWLLGAVVLLLLVAEYACRWLVPTWLPFKEERSKVWQYDRDFGWSQRPGLVNTRVKDPQFEISVTTNSVGLRDREYSLERTDKKRMLVLGDSFTWGFGVEDQERFTEVLEQRYPQWEIINAGTSGYGTDQEYLYYLKRGQYYKPDVVVVLFYYNDFENNFKSEQYYYPKPYFTLKENGDLVVHNQPVPPASLSQRFNHYIETQTVMLRRLLQVVEIITSRLTQPFQSKDAAGYTGGFTQFRESHAITNALLQKLKSTVEGNQSRFVVFALPIRPGLKRNLEELTKHGDWNYLNLDPFFAGTEEQTEIPDDEHWNAAGHRLAADLMENYLREKAIFP